MAGGGAAVFGLALPAGILLTLGGLAVSEGWIRRGGIEISKEESTAQKKIAEMISSARERIFIVSGAFNAETYEPLVARLLGKIREGLDVQIITGSALSAKSFDLLRPMLVYTNFQHVRVRGNPIPHGMLIDDHSLRIEKPHAPASKTRQNVFIEKPTVGAAVFLRTFERYKSQGLEVEGEQPSPIEISD